MSRTFELHIKQDGEWQKVTAVFPFTSADLLDERLDEGSITFFDRVKAHKPLTEVRITFYKDGQPDNDRYGKNTEYFIVANDNSAEYPVGSGVYKHETYIIERTKLLEGILCPSLTFTNSNDRNFSALKNAVIAVVDKPTESFSSIPEITSPVNSSYPVQVTSVKIVGENFALAYNADHAGFLVPERYYTPEENESSYSYLDIYGDGRAIVTNITSEDGYTLTTQQLSGIIDLEYRYHIILYYIDYDLMTHYIYYDIIFNLQTYQNLKLLKPYSITDCANRVLELAEPLTIETNPRFEFNGVTYNHGISEPNYEEGSQAEKFDKIIAPEFSMTQSTLREQLKVIGSYIHGEPWLDENNEVYFLEYGNVKQSPNVNKDTPYISNTLKTDINQYCTDIRSNAQNLVSSLGFAKGVITEPGGGLYRSLRTETMYARINEENGFSDTDFSIYSIQSVLCGVASGEETITGWLYPPKIITPYVFEETEYNANLSSFGGGYPKSKAWAIYYTQGKKGLRGLFHQNPDSGSTATYSPWAIANILAVVNGLNNPLPLYYEIQNKALNIVFQITYKPIAPAFISHGKQYYISGETPYTQIYNQGDNLIETQYYGEHLKGVSARLGNIEQERTYLLNSRSQIPKVGEMIDDYAISAVHCEYLPTYIKCMVGLSKDYQRISEYVGINSVKRMYEVSERQAQKRDILIKNSLVISDNPGSSDEYGIFNDNNLSAFINAFTDTADGIISAVVFSSYLKNREKLLHKVLLPCIGRSFGNSVHFAFTMKDNFSAGNATVWGSDAGVSGRWQSDVPYSDDYGRAYWSRIQLTNNVGDYSGDVGAFVGASFTLPNLGSLTPVYLNSYYHRLRKDNREIIGYNLEIEYKTDPDSDIIIGSELASRCRYISNDTSGVSIYLTNQDINKFDSTFIPKDNDFSNANAETNEFNYTVESDRINIFAIKDICNGYKNWVIVTTPKTEATQYIDEDGNIKTYETYTGGKILLAGQLLEKFIQEYGDYSRTLHFYFKRS